jgi:hypothetical protein
MMKYLLEKISPWMVVSFVVLFVIILQNVVSYEINQIFNPLRYSLTFISLLYIFLRVQNVEKFSFSRKANVIWFAVLILPTLYLCYATYQDVFVGKNDGLGMGLLEFVWILFIHISWIIIFRYMSEGGAPVYKSSKNVLIVVLVLVISSLISSFFPSKTTICLDGGGKWNYDLNMCERR